VVAHRILEDSDVATANDAKSDTAAKDRQNERSVVGEAAREASRDKSKYAHRRRRRMKYGSAQQRSDKSEEAEEPPKVELPEWFWENNVKLFPHPNSPGRSLALYGNEPNPMTPVVTDNKPSSTLGGASEATAINGDSENHDKNNRRHNGNENSPSGHGGVYALHSDVYGEILAATRTGLVLRPPPSLHLTKICRTNIHLLCPKPEGSNFLDSIVQRVAFDLRADLLILEPEDIAQILSDYSGQNIAWTWSTTSSLGYDTHQMAGGLESLGIDEPFEEEDEDDEDGLPPNSKPHHVATPSVHFKLNKLPPFLESLFKSTSSVFYPIAPEPLKLNSTTAQPSVTGPSEDNWMNHKISKALEAIIDAVEAKRRSSGTGLSDHSSDSTLPADGLIIQVNQYKDMSRNHQGSKILQSLKDVVKKRWYHGQNVMIIGTTAEDLGHLTPNSMRKFQSDERTILVPPQRSSSQDSIFAMDDRRRIRQINIRHLEHMTRQLAAATENSLSIDLQRNLPPIPDSPLPKFAQDIDRNIWSCAWIYRLAVILLGTRSPSTSIEGPAFLHALRALEASDNVKKLWGADEQEQEYPLGGTGSPIILDTERAANDRVRHIKKTCTTHEEKLLSGVVNPSDINTSFTDIQAPTETIEALKTLTSLSLARPESFSYGVLATDKITGVLLYGPPGTGKTLLAKAVAKESGATVLEVSAGELQDMFVGEGEKNVQAVFSLAKKLSPCVVFLDEADSILGSRGGESGRRGGHRDLINQFLKEWDGMRDISTLIMVATNRPFDLDEAILRRLPRKILMDLPLERDREAILKIHLRDELLDESVSLGDIAKQTPFYSGSDLKNLSVAAALACVCDENLVAAQHSGDSPYVFPTKRVLKKIHFDKAMEEISASISEDMSTLSAIRKFDATYGDRKGRRKRSAGLGFGGTMTPEKDSEAGRVRNIKLTL
jgi:SpoVK/Ycf46/Vps4 family AAA+-type ATPase